MVGKFAMRSLALIGLLCAAGSAWAGEAFPMPSTLPEPISAVEGVWLTSTQTEMTITQCPDGFCGYISKIVVPEKYRDQYAAQLEAVDPATFQDVNNKDPLLRTRPILGLQILTLHGEATGGHFDGEIYNPEDGNIYTGAIDMNSADEAKLKGCVLYVLCQEQLWERAPPPDPAMEEPAAQ